MKNSRNSVSTCLRVVDTRRAEPMKLFIVAAALTLALVSVTTQFPDAPTGFADKTNGIADDGTPQPDQMKFDEAEQPSDGLGPLDNTPSCRQRHPTPASDLTSHR